MATTIFPQNDPSAVDETEFSQQLAFPSVAYNHVRQGGQVTFNSGLDVDVAAIRGFIHGTYIDVDSSVTLTLPDNANNLIFLELTRSSGLVQSPTADADNFHVSTADADHDNDRILIARVDTSSGSVDSIYDMRWMTPEATWMRTLHDRLTINSDTTTNRVTGVEVPLPRNVLQDTGHATINARIICSGTANTGITIGWEMLELSGNHQIHWYAIDSGGNLVDSGRDASNASSGTLLDTASAFDGLVAIDGRIGGVNDTTPFWITVAQNTSNGDDTWVGKGSTVSMTYTQRWYNASANALR